MAKNEKTSNEVAKTASRVLKNKVVSNFDKRYNKICEFIDAITSEIQGIADDVFEFVDDAEMVAGSALTQAKDKKKV